MKNIARAWQKNENILEMQSTALWLLILMLRKCNIRIIVYIYAFAYFLFFAKKLLQF